MLQPTRIKCTECHQEKVPSEFHLRGRGHQTICKSCRNESARQDYKSRGKARLPHSPIQINTDNFPALAERIAVLEPRLRSKAAAFAHDALDADDIYGEMVESILRKCKPEDTDAFFLQCANWTAQAYLSKGMSYNQYVDNLDLDEEAVEQAGFKVVNARTVEDSLVEIEMSIIFKEVIKSLPFENQRVIAMLSVGMTQREIAGELKVSEQTISERMKRIREQIASKLEVNIEFSFA